MIGEISSNEHQSVSRTPGHNIVCLTTKATPSIVEPTLSSLRRMLPFQWLCYRNVSWRNRLHSAKSALFLRENGSHPCRSWFDLQFVVILDCRCGGFFSTDSLRHFSRFTGCVRIYHPGRRPLVIRGLEDLYSLKPCYKGRTATGRYSTTTVVTWCYFIGFSLPFISCPVRIFFAPPSTLTHNIFSISQHVRSLAYKNSELAKYRLSSVESRVLDINFLVQ
jgi:hypothetical protein